jgi:hypothetical protein
MTVGCNVFMFTGHCGGIRPLKVRETFFPLSAPHFATLDLLHCAPLNAGWFRKED